ncbi:DsbA family oxidoreductase [Paenibacillus radicis (ex Gao et al. 2016)]|uniref:DSBA oxidoreductase n=1 Tax=Paenibacillus radicis (ex Gao et al. 2016) TaxID=1737354 RepID=A0A917HVR2_9BACL|nr:DsbA family oxidoreductase [Paenibacillus radicis (ex Gao et al. 2016)]GGG90969.1 DSBA oxidoreductase [Paenibacillus radicis (ex Gao et al. 2016)]
MKIEVWSDFACPFCYIGKRRLEGALEQFAHRDDVEVEFRSFELDPNAKRDVDYDVNDMLSKKYGMSREQAEANNRNLTEQARTLGLDYHMDKMVLTNTFDAHRLTHLAAKSGKREEMAERLFKAYFTEGKHLGDHDTLADLAVEVGIDRGEALEALKSPTYTQEVRADEQEASQIGVRGVPFFVIDRKYAVSGAQPSEVFLQAVQQAYQESKPLTVIGGDEGDDASCTDGVCAPKQ